MQETKMAINQALSPSLVVQMLANRHFKSCHWPKIAIMSDKPQTTRNKVQGVLTTDDSQMIFIDTRYSQAKT